jgi:hypothetical protein
MVYLTMLSRANITVSAYGILSLGHYLNVVRFVCVGQMLKDRWYLKLPGGGGVKHEANNLALYNDMYKQTQ